MPVSGDHSPAQERAEPASANFSPVARDYPSRVLSDFFQDRCTATVLSRNEEEDAPSRTKNKGFLLHNLFTMSGKCTTCGQAVNNFGLLLVLEEAAH